MNTYVIEYDRCGKSVSVAVVDDRTILQLCEIVDSGFSEIILFELEDGNSNFIGLKKEKIIAIYQIN